MFSATELVDVSEKLGLIQAVKFKLISQPDLASSKLIAVLEEVSKIYGALEQELTRYLSLTLDPTLEPKERAREREALLSLESGMITARMREARGHCGKIYHIYDRYLSPWFQRVLNPDEVSKMQTLFRELSDIDSYMVDAINEVSRWLAAEASATLDLVEQGEDAAAQKRVAEARRQVQFARRQMSKAMFNINDIKGDFIEQSGAI